MSLKDSYGRYVTQARISLNSSSSCNFSCNFCHKEGIEESESVIITPKEIERVVNILNNFGINTIKLTGGEPMLRKDIAEIVERINCIGSKEISLTTNGTNLVKYAQDLKSRGLNRVNISLHTLNENTFKIITGVNKLNQTIKAIEASIDANLVPVKINITLLRGINNDEVYDLIEFSRSLGGGKTNVLQIIELVYTQQDYFTKYHFPLNSVEDYLKRNCFTSTESMMRRRPKYELSNGVTVEIVKPMHNSLFCNGCNRLRITHDGKFKPCLLRSDNTFDFLTPMRNGADDSRIIEIFKKSIAIREPFFKTNDNETNTFGTIFSHECTQI